VSVRIYKLLRVSWSSAWYECRLIPRWSNNLGFAHQPVGVRKKGKALYMEGFIEDIPSGSWLKRQRGGARRSERGAAHCPHRQMDAGFEDGILHLSDEMFRMRGLDLHKNPAARGTGAQFLA